MKKKEKEEGVWVWVWVFWEKEGRLVEGLEGENERKREKIDWEILSVLNYG